MLLKEKRISMIFKFGDKVINVDAQKQNSKISVSTGKELSTYAFTIDICGKKNIDEFQALIDKYRDEDLSEIDAQNNIVSRFRITNSSYCYTGISEEDTDYHFTIKISECEILKTSILTIAGIACTVISYHEEIDDATDAIIINAIIKQTEQDREKIYNCIGESTYFDVVRNDISDRVLRMRYGKTIWSKHDGFIKRKIVLVQENYDGANSGLMGLGINEPEIRNMQKILACQTRYTDLLESLLIKKGILSRKEVEEIKKQTKDTYINKYSEYTIVDDVENCGW